jgi:hypothetical protein
MAGRDARTTAGASAQIQTTLFAKWSNVLAMAFAFCYLNTWRAQEGRGE